MKTLIALAVAASVLSVTSASAQFYKHEEGVSYGMISKCLQDEFGFEPDVHFRRKPGKEPTVQWNENNVVGDGLGKFVPLAQKCWKKQVEAEEKTPPKKK